MNSDGTLTFALDAQTGVMRHVRELENTGQACGCICPGCRAPLEAVNALNPHPKHRPHFRHLAQEETNACRSAMVKSLLEEVLPAGTPVTLPIRPIREGLFDATTVVATPEPIAEMVVRDATSALLRFPDGREYRVQVIVTDTRTSKKEGGSFDLVLDLRGSGLDSTTCSVEVLRRYLTLDSSAWRWCRFQTTPAPLAPAVPEVPRTDGPIAPILLDDGELEPPSLLTRLVPDVPGANEPAQSADPNVPKRSWQERHVFRDGSVLIADRQVWHSGVMTETTTRLPPGSEKWVPKGGS